MKCKSCLDGLWISMVLLLLQLNAAAQNSYGAPGGRWVPATTSWIGNTGTDPWTLTPRTGLQDDPFPGVGTDSVTRKKFDTYYISERMQGYLEYLPSGYNLQANAQKRYPLIIYIPGCGEIHDGRVYTHRQTNGSITPNYERGLFRMMKTDFGSDHFKSLPRELLKNGDYFSAIPIKTVGRNYSYTTGATQGVIVLCLMISHVDATVCGNGKYYVPTRFDVDKAIDLAKNLYRVDASRIYLTGMSAGAGVHYLYSFEDVNMAKKISAIIPVSSIETMYPDNNGQRAARLVSAGVSAMAIVNSDDAGFDVANNNTYSINQIKAAPGYMAGQAELFKFTDKNLFSHDAWSVAYQSRYAADNNQTPGRWYTYTDNTAPTPERYTTYEWMLTRQNLLLLPVNVTRFSVTRSNTSVRLDWVTATEINSDHFTLERSVNGTDFTRLATIAAAGNADTEKRYAHSDANLPQGQYVYYRLSQTDIDGRTQVIGTRRVYLGTTGMELSLYPSIASTSINLEIQGLVNEPLTMRVMDMAGRQSMQQVIAPRQNRVAIDVSGLGRGMYLVQLMGSNTNLTSKFVKQ